MDKESEDKIQGLLNKVNKVTCPFRHGQKISDKDMTELANRQLEFEEWFSTRKDIDKNN